MEKNDGGPAFPHMREEWVAHGWPEGSKQETVKHPGMSLRAYIATAIYAQTCGNFRGSGDALADAKDEMAKLACEMTDALIAELAK